MELGRSAGHQNAIQAAERIRCVSRRQRIVRPLTIHDEAIFVPSRLEHHFSHPTAIGLSFQRHGGWMPPVEGAGDEHRLGVGSIESKADALSIGAWKPLGQQPGRLGARLGLGSEGLGHAPLRPPFGSRWNCLGSGRRWTLLLTSDCGCFHYFFSLSNIASTFDLDTQLSLKRRYDNLCCGLDAHRGCVDG